MRGDEITFDDLLDDEPGSGEPPADFKQLLANGFPTGCGLEGLAMIENMKDPGPEFAAIRREYLRLLEIQRKRLHPTAHSETAPHRS